MNTAGQRRINIIWEVTQASIAVMITAALIYCEFHKVESKALTYAFVSIVTMYFARTNHQAIGGVGPKPQMPRYEGR